MALRVIAALDKLDDVDPIIREAIKALYGRGRLSLAPDSLQLELLAEQIAVVVESAFPLQLKEQLRSLDLGEALILINVAIGVFLKCPVKIKGGMFDKNGRDRHVGGNGWGQLAGAARNWGSPYTARWVRKSLNDRPELWVPEHRKYKPLRPWVSWGWYADGRAYPSTGDKYPIVDARKLLMLPADVYRHAFALPVVKSMVRAFYAATPVKRQKNGRRTDQARIGQMLRAWKRAARNIECKQQERQGKPFEQAIQWSKAEVYTARKEGVVLPPYRRKGATPDARLELKALLAIEKRGRVWRRQADRLLALRAKKQGSTVEESRLWAALVSALNARTTTRTNAATVPTEKFIPKRDPDLLDQRKKDQKDAGKAVARAVPSVLPPTGPSPEPSPSHLENPSSQDANGRESKENAKAERKSASSEAKPRPPIKLKVAIEDPVDLSTLSGRFRATPPERKPLDQVTIELKPLDDVSQGELFKAPVWSRPSLPAPTRSTSEPPSSEVLARMQLIADEAGADLSDPEQYEAVYELAAEQHWRRGKRSQDDP